jgi:predicted MPP superfamily phosphohydrolase
MLNDRQPLDATPEKPERPSTIASSIKRLAWLTDIHLNFVQPGTIETLCGEIMEERPDAVLISGDIGEAHDLAGYLLTLENRLQFPIYFVLGNHDFYRGSIAQVRASVAILTEHSANLYWLSQAGVVEMTPTTAILGHDGWADGRFGNAQSRVFYYLSDFRLIREFVGLDRGATLAKLAQLGDEAADFLAGNLREACERFLRIIIVTHVPPFKEATWYEGHMSEADWLPYFSCKAVGEVLLAAADAYPNCQMIVLCGHTHGSGTATIRPNLHVLTGGAKYGSPKVQKVFEVE